MNPLGVQLRELSTVADGFVTPGTAGEVEPALAGELHRQRRWTRIHLQATGKVSRSTVILSPNADAVVFSFERIASS